MHIVVQPTPPPSFLTLLSPRASNANSPPTLAGPGHCLYGSGSPGDLTLVGSHSVCPLRLDHLLSATFSGFVHAVAGVGVSFLLKAERYSVVWMDHCVRPSVGRRAHRCLLSALVNGSVFPRSGKSGCHRDPGEGPPCLSPLPASLAAPRVPWLIGTSLQSLPLFVCPNVIFPCGL